MAAKMCALIIGVCLISFIAEGRAKKRDCPLWHITRKCLNGRRNVFKRVQTEPSKKFLDETNSLDFNTERDFEKEDFFLERK